MSVKISPVSFTGLQQASKTQTKKTNFENSVVSTPIKSIKNDTFEKKPFDIDEAMDKLGEIKSKKSGIETPKFGPVHYASLRYTLSKNPEKFDSVYGLATKEHVSGHQVVELAKMDTERLNTVKLYSDANTVDKKPRYSGQELVQFGRSRMSNEDLKNELPLTRTSLSAENIQAFAGSKKPKAFFEKAANVTEDFEKNVLKNNFQKLVLTSDKSDNTAFNLVAQTSEYELKSVLLDKDMNKEAVEEMGVYRSQKGSVYQIKKTNDLRNNTTSKVRFTVDKQGYPVVTNEVRVVKDKNNKVVKTEYTAPSEVPGVFDIKVKHADGRVDVVSSGKVDKKNGITSIKKNLVSLDGTRTDYLYENDENGNRISDYKITDKNGKVLLEKSATFEVVSPNKIISSNNNDKYEILLDEKNIKVTDMNNPKKSAVIDIDKSIRGNKKKILASLKQMPGEELIKLSQSTKSLTGIDNELESYYMPRDKSIHSGDQLFVVLHELGHARDMRDVDINSNLGYAVTIDKAVFADEKLNKLYNKEKDNFNKAFPDAQRDHIDYFINTLNHYGGEVGGLRETIAESNALLTTPKTMDILAIRSQYLQQYFPRTIAHLSTLLNQQAEA